MQTPPHTVSIAEFLEAQTQLEEEAAEAIPFAFSSCTFPNLAESRQPIFSCLTCRPQPLKAEDRAGICAGCSVSCHGDCELVELFFRRNMTCDCGTSRLPTRKCAITLRNNESPSSENHYDKNYDGIFCSCNIRYDPETEEDEMVQCLMCEDWFHTDKCLGLRKGAGPAGDGFKVGDFEHLVCQACVEGPGLATFGRYAGTRHFTLLPTKAQLRLQSQHPVTATSSIAEPDLTTSNSLVRKRSATADDHATLVSRLKRPKLDNTASTECSAPDRVHKNGPPRGHILLQEGWRDQWCRCGQCSPLYVDLPYLLEEETVFEPPDDPDAERSLHDLGISALSQLPRDQAIQGLEAYQTVKDKLMSFLKPFAREGRVVSKEDIEAFFESQHISSDA